MGAVEELYAEIENPVFTANVGVVSSLRSFERAIAQQGVARALLGELGKGNALADFYDHFVQLVRAPREEHFTHAHDIALAVYLSTVDIVDGMLSLECARQVRSTAGMWWAAKIADRILSGSDSATSIGHHVGLAHSEFGAVSRSRSLGFPPQVSAKSFFPATDNKEYSYKNASTGALGLVHFCLAVNGGFVPSRLNPKSSSTLEERVF